MGTHTNAPAARDDTRRVLDAIRRIVHEMRTSSRQAEKRVKLSAAQLFVLQKLGESQAASLNELAERTHTHQSSVSVVVRRLVERGLIRRSTSAADGRRRTLCLTPAGRAVLGRSPQAAQDRLIAAIAKLPETRRSTLADLLEAVAGAAGRAPPLFFEDSASEPGKHAPRH